MKTIAAFLIVVASAAHAQFAVMHTNGVVTSPTNLTIEQGNVAGLTQALDSKLATNGSAAALTNFPSSLLSHGTNGQVIYTNTNSLTFLKNITLDGPSTNNPPTLFWKTSDGIGNGVLFAFSKAAMTNLWDSPTNAHTNWSGLFLGQNIAPNNTGTDVGHPVQTMGSIYLVMENNYNYNGIPNNPASETYFVTRDTNGYLHRSLQILGSQTNARYGNIGSSYPFLIFPLKDGIDAPEALQAPFSVIWENSFIGGFPHVFLYNPATNASRDVKLEMLVGNSPRLILSAEPSKHYMLRPNFHYVFIGDTNGLLLGSTTGGSPLAPLHLAGNTRIDGAISFNNTTSAATTVTNLGLGGGVTTNVSSGTLQFSNGILIGHTP